MLAIVTINICTFSVEFRPFCIFFTILSRSKGCCFYRFCSIWVVTIVFCRCNFCYLTRPQILLRMVIWTNVMLKNEKIIHELVCADPCLEIRGSCWLLLVFCYDDKCHLFYPNRQRCRPWFFRRNVKKRLTKRVLLVESVELWVDELKFFLYLWRE
jgi:hypothetical protein